MEYSRFGFVFMAVQTGVLAVGLAFTYFLKIPLEWDLSRDQFAYAIIFTLPLILLAILFTSPVGLGVDFIRRIFERITSSPMGPFIQNAPLWAFALVSALAGFGEEILFRGGLQPKIGLFVAAGIFGLCHLITLPFFTIATLIGAYLGAVYLWGGTHILVPIIIHATYDFVVLILMRRAIE